MGKKLINPINPSQTQIILDMIVMHFYMIGLQIILNESSALIPKTQMIFLYKESTK